MSAFDKGDTVLSAFHTPILTLTDHLIMIDMAYARQDRATCTSLIDNLYAHFDAAGHRL